HSDADWVEKKSTKSGLDTDRNADKCESEYHYLCLENNPEHDPRKTDPPDCDCQFCNAIDLTISGLIEWEEFTEWVEDLSLYPEDCLTCGTIGSPLTDGMPYLVWDIPF